MFKFGIARKIATSDWIVLLYTTGLYCLKSSDVKPLSWMILKQGVISLIAYVAFRNL